MTPWDWTLAAFLLWFMIADAIWKSRAQKIITELQAHITGVP